MPLSDRPERFGRSGPRPSPERPIRRVLPRYRLVLVPDPQLDLMHLVRSIMELTRSPREEATHKMWQAHHSGRAVLLQTYLERAELYAEQFAGKGITLLLERI
jgi:ATP-dependent Clp protease adapter protein ClpS